MGGGIMSNVLERIEYNIFNGTETREGAFSVEQAVGTNDIRRIVAEREDLNLDGLVVDRQGNKFVFRVEAIYG
jgi:hypothetical protein